MAKRRGLLERDVTAQIVGFLKAKGFLCFRLHSGTVRGATGGAFIKLNPKGCPDWLCVRGFDSEFGNILFVEMKREVGGVVSKEQEIKKLQLESQKFRCIIAASLDGFKSEYEKSYGD